MSANRASFAKFVDGSWGIRVDAGSPGPVQVAPGDEIEVAKRNGGTKRVVVVRVVETFDGGRSAFCSIAPANGNGNGNAPRPDRVAALEQRVDLLSEAVAALARQLTVTS